MPKALTLNMMNLYSYLTSHTAKIYGFMSFVFKRLGLVKCPIILVAIDGYNCIHQSKRAECNNHGGLITYVDNKYEVDRLDIKNDSSLWENLFVSIKGTGHNKDVIVGNIYKPPKDNYNIENINTFTTEIENVIHELDSRNSEIIIAGDYNMNLLNLDVRQAFSYFLTQCYPTVYSPESLYPLD